MLRWLKRLFGGVERPETFVIVTLNVGLMPFDRGEHFEDPLDAALRKANLGSIGGGGSGLAEEGGVEYSEIEVGLYDLEKGVPFLVHWLNTHNTPKGSRISWENAQGLQTIPVGNAEGVGLYLNSTELPSETYNLCDLNELVDSINETLGSKGRILSSWAGETENALFIYGPSARDIRAALPALTAASPLCERCRIVDLRTTMP